MSLLMPAEVPKRVLRLNRITLSVPYIFKNYNLAQSQDYQQKNKNLVSIEINYCLIENLAIFILSYHTLLVIILFEHVFY